MIDLITGHQGIPHISAEQIASINNAMMDNYGANKVMRLVGGELTANGLTIEVSTGYWRANGFDMEVQEAETIYIDPTAAGLSRIDNIYVEILQDIPTGAQRSEIVTVNGEPSATPTAPEAPTAPELNTDILLQVVPLASVTVTEGAMVMTDLTIAYEMVTPSELEAVETIATGAQTAAGNAQTTANTANTNANHALAMIKDSDDAYSPSKPYKVGDYVIYNNTVYKCITACSAASWTVNQSNFEEDTLIGAVTDLNSALNGVVLHDSGTISLGQGVAYKVTIPSIASYKKIIVLIQTNNYHHDEAIIRDYYVKGKTHYSISQALLSGSTFYNYGTYVMYDANYQLTAAAFWTGYAANWNTLTRVVVIGTNVL